MRALLVVALFCAPLLAVPVASANVPDPMLLVVLATYEASCALQEGGYALHQEGPTCWGLVRATDCFVAALEGLAGLQGSCPS